MTGKEKTNSDKNTVRLLGVAFLVQAVASVVSNLILLEPLIVSGNIIDSMTNIANHSSQLRASIVVEMITVMAIVMLGSLLFITLKKQNGKIALVAFGLYLVEVAILAASRIPAFALLCTSQESVLAGHPVYLQTLGNLFYDLQDFGNWLHMLPFALGATLWYYLFYKSGYIPRLLNLWGLIAAPLALIGTLFVLFDYDIPLVVFLPNLPFELAIGLWLLIRGVKDQQPDSTKAG